MLKVTRKDRVLNSRPTHFLLAAAAVYQNIVQVAPEATATVPIVGSSLNAASNSKLLTVPVIGPPLTAASNSKLLTVVVVGPALTLPAGGVPFSPLTGW